MQVPSFLSFPLPPTSPNKHLRQNFLLTRLRVLGFMLKAWKPKWRPTFHTTWCTTSSQPLQSMSGICMGARPLEFRAQSVRVRARGPVIVGGTTTHMLARTHPRQAGFGNGQQ